MEESITKRFENLQSQTSDEAKKKALNLKIRANKPTGFNNFYESGKEEGKMSQEIDTMRLEMVRELRDMKNGL